MKKLILFLLLPLWAMAQTTTGQEQEFDYGIKNNSAQTITTPPYLTTTGMDGTQGKIPSALIEKTDNKQNSLAVDGTGTKYPTVTAVNTGLALKALDSNVIHKTGNETVAGVKRFSENTVFGNAQIPGILPEYHLTEFNAPDNKSPIAISGGTSVIEYWKETEVPSYAWATGLRNPSVHLEPKDSFKFSVSIDAAPFADVLDISDGGNLYTKGVLSENITTLTPTISGQPSIIKYVNSLNTTQPVKLVIYFHGAGTKQLDPFTDDSKILIDALLSKGYIVAHSQAHGDNWGSQTAQNDYLALYNYISSAYNLSDVIFVGHSMGGLASLTMIAKNTIPAVTKWYGIFPVTNLYEAYYTEGFSSAIESAYGFTGSANYATGTAGNDPNLLTASSYYGRVYRFVASSSDLVVTKSTNTDLLNTKLLSDGRINTSIISATGNHGDISHFIPKDICYFIKSDVQSKINTNYLPKLDVNGNYVNSEIYMTGKRVDIGVLGTSGAATGVPKLAIYNGDGSQNGDGGIEIRNNSSGNGFSKRIQSYYNGDGGYTFAIQERSNNVNWSNQFEISDTGVLKVPNLSGAGNRLVYSDASGNLSAPDAPTAPTAAPGTTGNQIATLDYVLANRGATSGTYTPTLYDFANTSARKLVKATYSKIGDIVTVFIHLTVDVITANTDTVVTVSLPINKVNTSLYELGAGVGRLSSVNTNEFTVRTSNVTNTNDIIRLVFKPVSSGTNIVSASFSYAIN